MLCPEHEISDKPQNDGLI